MRKTLFYTLIIYLSIFPFRFLQSQTLDAAFPATNGTVNKVLIHGNTLYVGGQFTKIGGIACANLAAIDIPTKTVKSWFPAVNKAVGDITAANGVVYICGGFTTVGSSGRNALAAIDSVSGTVTNFNPDIVFPGIPGMQTGTVSSIRIKNNLLYISGYFIKAGGLSRDNIAAIDVNTGNITSFNPHPDIPVNVIELYGDQLYIGGPFYNVNNESRKGFAAVDLSDGAVTDWDPNPDLPGNTKYAIVKDGDYIHVAGFFTALNDVPRHNIAQTDLSGAATSWNANMPFVAQANLVKAMAVSGNNLVAGGTFYIIGGASRANLAMLNKATGSANSWDPVADGEVLTLAVNDTMIVAGGAFQNMDGIDRTGLAVFKMSSVGVKPVPPADKITTFPNPATSEFTVESREGRIQSVDLFNLTGQSVNIPVQLSDRKVTITTAQLPEGIYFLRVLTGEKKQFTVKVMVNR